MNLNYNPCKIKFSSSSSSSLSLVLQSGTIHLSQCDMQFCVWHACSLCMHVLCATCMVFVRHAWSLCDMHVLYATSMFFVRHPCSLCDIHVLCVTCMFFVRHVCSLCDMHVLCATCMFFVWHACLREKDESFQCASAGDNGGLLIFDFFRSSCILLLICTISFPDVCSVVSSASMSQSTDISFTCNGRSLTDKETKKNRSQNRTLWYTAILYWFFRGVRAME